MRLDYLRSIKPWPIRYVFVHAILKEIDNKFFSAA